ncbi:MAG TPA: glycoside hydrolase family 15 protein [Actinomycetota bacterium]|nr:glycoside hydrolase family 15 protein [Actinomycetota bacterium]
MAAETRPLRSAYPPIADYAFLSDREVNALVAPSGNVEWMCVPRPDSPSVFGAILDRAAGGFRVGPAGVSVPVARRYLPGSLVLETTWQTATGWLVVRDALVIGPWHTNGRRAAYRRSPGDYEAEHMLVRTVRCTYGMVELALACEPVFDFGRVAPRWEYDADDYHRVVARGDDPLLSLTLLTNLRLGLDGRRATAYTRLRAGETAFAALSWGSERELTLDATDAEKRIEQTEAFWREWLQCGRFPDHRWRQHLHQSALTLKGLIYVPTGALLAAATTSLPETPQGERNWDYRFSWIRDSAFALWGLYTLGFAYEADSFFSFIADASEQSMGFQPMYGVSGEKDLDEQVLDHLDGYDGARPVRAGNGAYRHEQHDVWGTLIDSVYLHTRPTGNISEAVWALVERAVDSAIKNWRKPDRGMWEVRGEPKHFTSSKLMCWVACDRGARLALWRGDKQTAARWWRTASEIHKDVCANGVDGRGVFVQHYDTTALDASLLLMPLVRFLPPDDPRIRATVLAIADELTVDGLVLRYRVEETDDGLSGEEGAFLMCSFWLVSALVEIGEVDRARELCERLLSYSSPLGLFGEEVDPATGAHLGNFPQAFTHLALINAVMHVIRAEEARPGWWDPGVQTAEIPEGRHVPTENVASPASARTAHASRVAYTSFRRD